MLKIALSMKYCVMTRHANTVYTITAFKTFENILKTQFSQHFKSNA